MKIDIPMPDLSKLSREMVLYVVVALLVGFGSGYHAGKNGWTLPTTTTQPPVVVPAVKVTAAVYIYEKDSGGVPAPVTAALSELNAQGIIATTFEEDATNPSQQVPKQYAKALPAAREAGLPALVVSGGDRVLAVVKSPKTKASVLEAAKQ